MHATERYSGHDRRTRDRSQGIVLRRRTKQPVSPEREQRRSASNGFDIAAALEMHLDQAPTRRAMLALLESWLTEAKHSEATEHDEHYEQAVAHAMEVMKAAPDPTTAIAILQRRASS